MIEKGIPFPGSSKAPPTYPWAVMEVGDSFLAPTSVRSMATASMHAGKKNGMTFRCKAVDGGTRVWRLA